MTVARSPSGRRGLSQPSPRGPPVTCLKPTCWPERSRDAGSNPPRRLSMQPSANTPPRPHPHLCQAKAHWKLSIVSIESLYGWRWRSPTAAVCRCCSPCSSSQSSDSSSKKQRVEERPAGGAVSRAHAGGLGPEAEGMAHTHTQTDTHTEIHTHTLSGTPKRGPVPHTLLPFLQTARSDSVLCVQSRRQAAGEQEEEQGVSRAPRRGRPLQGRANAPPGCCTCRRPPCAWGSSRASGPTRAAATPSPAATAKVAWTGDRLAPKDTQRLQIDTHSLRSSWVFSSTAQKFGHIFPIEWENASTFWTVIVHTGRTLAEQYFRCFR